MKSEVGSFTPDNSSVTVLLNNYTLNVKAVFFQVCKNGANVNGSTGFDDSIKRRGKYELYDTVKDSARSSAYSIFHNKNSGGVSTVALRGKVDTDGFATAGQFVLAFDNFDANYTVDFVALGD